MDFNLLIEKFLIIGADGELDNISVDRIPSIPFIIICFEVSLIHLRMKGLSEMKIMIFSSIL